MTTEAQLEAARIEAIKRALSPTPEWYEKHKGRLAAGGTGRMESASLEIQTETHYDIIHRARWYDEDFSSSIDTFIRALEGYLASQGAWMGKRGGGGTDEESGMPFADLYVKLSEWFANNRRSINAAKSRFAPFHSAPDQFKDIELLAEFIAPGIDIALTRDAMLPFSDQYYKALLKLEQAIYEVREAWKAKHEK